jgi:hypothetical protein
MCPITGIFELSSGGSLGSWALIRMTQETKRPILSANVITITDRLAFSEIIDVSMVELAFTSMGIVCCFELVTPT